MSWPILFEPSALPLHGAACAGHPEPLWDECIDGELADQRAARHRQAVAVCATCPVTWQCLARRDEDDGGIYAGLLFRGRGRPIGRQVYGTSTASHRVVDVEPCAACGCSTVPESIRRRRPDLHRHRGRIGGLCGACYARQRPKTYGQNKRRHSDTPRAG